MTDSEGTQKARWMRRRAPIVWGIAGLMVVAIAGIGIAVTRPAVIHGCYRISGGALRILTTGHCTSKERAINWNQVGPRGPSGVTSIPTGYAYAYSGSGGVLVPDAGGSVVSLTSASASGSGVLRVAVRSRLVINAALSLLGSGPAVHVHAECQPEVGQAGTPLLIVGLPSFETLINTAEYRDVPVTGVFDVAPGSYNVGVWCDARSGGSGHVAVVTAALTVVAEPK